MKTQKPSNNDMINKQIEDALNSNQIQFEDMPDENSSPLNQPVVEKSFNEAGSVNQHVKEDHSNDVSSTADDQDSDDEQEDVENRNQNDAPEQQISQEDLQSMEGEGEGLEIPLSHATMAAGTFIGVADNILELGGGFFVTINKHEDFYEFEEVIEVIDEQNNKNVKRFRLDAEDKALLRPLLIIIIRKRAKVLSPEQQLAAAVLSIMVKKFRLAMQIRAENEILVERIRDIVRTETSKHQVNVKEASAQEHPIHASQVNMGNQTHNNVLEVAD